MSSPVLNKINLGMSFNEESDLYPFNVWQSEIPSDCTVPSVDPDFLFAPRDFEVSSIPTTPPLESDYMNWSQLPYMSNALGSSYLTPHTLSADLEGATPVPLSQLTPLPDLLTIAPGDIFGMEENQWTAEPHYRIDIRAVNSAKECFRERDRATFREENYEKVRLGDCTELLEKYRKEEINDGNAPAEHLTALEQTKDQPAFPARHGMAPYGVIYENTNNSSTFRSRPPVSSADNSGSFELTSAPHPVQEQLPHHLAKRNSHKRSATHQAVPQTISPLFQEWIDEENAWRRKHHRRLLVFPFEPHTIVCVWNEKHRRVLSFKEDQVSDLGTEDDNKSALEVPRLVAFLPDEYKHVTIRNVTITPCVYSNQKANAWFREQLKDRIKCSCNTFKFEQGYQHKFKHPSVLRQHVARCPAFRSNPLSRLAIMELRKY